MNNSIDEKLIQMDKNLEYQKSKQKFMKLNQRISKKNTLLNNVITESRKNHIKNDNIKIINNFRNYFVRKTIIINSYKFEEQNNKTKYDKLVKENKIKFDISKIIGKNNFIFKNINQLSNFKNENNSKIIKNIKPNDIKNYLNNNFLINKKERKSKYNNKGSINIVYDNKILNFKKNIEKIKSDSINRKSETFKSFFESKREFNKIFSGKK